MVWIGLHGVMFLFLFSDFYKQAYKNRGLHKKTDNAIKVNGHTANSDNKGACMVSLSQMCDLSYDFVVLFVQFFAHH